MTDRILCSEADLIINRESSKNGLVHIFGGNGYLLASLPAKLSGDDIFSALKWANNAYAKGFRDGESQKAKDIREALEIDE